MFTSIHPTIVANSGKWHMHDMLASLDEEDWVIWNGNHGLVTTVTVGRVEVGTSGRMAWLDEPFDMVGPFSLDEFERRQVRAAFRRLAQKAHPDVGGSNEQFVRIKEARNALLEYIS